MSLPRPLSPCFLFFAMLWIGLSGSLLALPAQAQQTQNRSWTDDKPFHQIRVRIDEQVNAGKPAGELAIQYADGVKQHPFDAQDVFQYAYAAYRAYQHNKKSNNYLVDALNAIHQPLPSHSYEYERLQFLLEGQYNPSTLQKPVGLLLLKHNPNDDDVKFLFVESLNPGRSLQERQLALHYVADLIRKTPNAPRGYALLGYVYDIANAQNHDPSDGDKAIAAYRHYLKIAPLNDDFRQAALSHIQSVQMLQRFQSRRESRGKK